MKINTRKLLLFLYKEDETQQNIITYDHLFYLWNDLSAGGSRSLIHHLQKAKLIQAVKVNGEVGFTLTLVGKQVIAHHYTLEGIPLREEKDECLLILLASPPSDPQFRFLLQKVKAEGSMIKKGIYLLRQPSSQLISLCKEKYYNSVVLTAIKEWVVGDPQLVGQTHLLVQSVNESLSGISTQITRLIDMKNSFSSLNHQEKMVIFSAFDRLVLIFDQLATSPNYSFLAVTSGKQLLSTFQQFILRE